GPARAGYVQDPEPIWDAELATSGTLAPTTLTTDGVPKVHPVALWSTILPTHSVPGAGSQRDYARGAPNRGEKRRLGTPARLRCRPRQQQSQVRTVT